MMMARFFGTLLIVLLLMPVASFSDNSDVAQAPNCPICGMDRQKFAHSRMLIEYQDDTVFGACSLHCAAIELAYRPGKIPVKMSVGDYFTKQLIDAENAVWVIGGSKMGVMTRVAKWAFADKAGAQKFVDQFGGRMADFESAITAAYTDMYKDTRMIREKRKKMGHLKKGKMSHAGHGDHGGHKHQ